MVARPEIRRWALADFEQDFAPKEAWMSSQSSPRPRQIRCAHARIRAATRAGIFSGSPPRPGNRESRHVDMLYSVYRMLPLRIEVCPAVWMVLEKIRISHGRDSAVAAGEAGHH